MSKELNSIDTDKPFEYVDGSPVFHGVPVALVNTTVAGQTYSLAVLRDAAALLDDPVFAARFLDRDMAPYGLQLWDAAIALSEFLQEFEPTAEGRALELGCGSGLVSMVLARSGWKVTATDYEPATIAFARYNALQNNVRGCQFEMLDWRHFETGEKFDLIVGADVAYQLSDHAPLLSCISANLAQAGRAYLCDPMRSVADRLPEAARESGLDALQQSWEWRSPVRVWKLTHRCS